MVHNTKIEEPLSYYQPLDHDGKNRDKDEETTSTFGKVCCLLPSPVVIGLEVLQTIVQFTVVLIEVPQGYCSCDDRNEGQDLQQERSAREEENR